MRDEHYNRWDIAISTIASLVTAISVVVSVILFSRQQTANTKLELDKAYWTQQNDVYVSICNDVGRLAANVDNPKEFEAAKTDYMTHYYGQSILVEDELVEKQMVEIHDFLIGLKVEDLDENSILTLKTMAIQMSDRCKKSSITLKHRTIE